MKGRDLVEDTVDCVGGISRSPLAERFIGEVIAPRLCWWCVLHGASEAVGGVSP